MDPLPITYVMYLTTEGFGGCNTLYQATLDHTERQMPLSSFRHRLASIKITPGREHVAEAMTKDLNRRGFEVITATAPWQRGLSHYEQYHLDMRRVSQHPLVYNTPFIFVTDHDYPILTYRDPLIVVIRRMIDIIESSPDVLSIRFLREEDVNTLAPDLVVATEPDRNIAWHRHYNLQPALLRSRDYHLACKIIEDNWSVATKMHGEALWREVMAPFSRSERKHAVWLPGYAQVANLGTPDYLEVAKRLSLTIAPNL